MKQKIVTLIASGVLLTAGVKANITDDFNTRPGISHLQLKNYLQNQCWAFPGFDVNPQNWNPGIEGDGAMVSVFPAQNMGIYTPVLNVPERLYIAFTYKFNKDIQPGARRWMKIYLTNAHNNVARLLDSLEFTGISNTTFYSYAKTFTYLTPGLYKVFIKYDGYGGSTNIAIDQLNISASLHYAGGCNSSPIAVNDQFTGAANRHAAGNVLLNDSDPDHESFTAYLITNSPDGTVALNIDGTFVFTPHEGFTGNTTSFTYKICDKGSLCSEDAVVNINFPTDNVPPMSLVDFKGYYRDKGEVELNWVTNFEQSTQRFELERSFDGNKWKKVAIMDAQVNSGSPKSYEVVDDLSRSKVEKKDLFYRLKQVNQDGRVSMSRILIVRVYNTRALKMLCVTPNPSVNDISVTTQLNETSFVAMKIRNAGGGIVMKKSVKAQPGSNSFMIEGSNKLKPGEYVLEVLVNSKERMLVQLIKE